jgi:hypothetical protein
MRFDDIIGTMVRLDAPADSARTTFLLMTRRDGATAVSSVLSSDECVITQRLMPLVNIELEGFDELIVSIDCSVSCVTAMRRDTSSFVACNIGTSLVMVDSVSIIAPVGVCSSKSMNFLNENRVR